MTYYDVTMDIPSNIISYCDVIMGHETKTYCPQCDHTKHSSQNGISTGDLGMEIPFKTGHKTLTSGGDSSFHKAGPLLWDILSI